MPFRGVVEDFKAGEIVKLVTAEQGDVEVTISIKPYGATGTSGAPNFWVGGPDLEHGLGLLVTGNEWTTALEPGDELWVRHAEALPFAESWTITALIRSTRHASLRITGFTLHIFVKWVLSDRGTTLKVQQDPRWCHPVRVLIPATRGCKAALPSGSRPPSHIGRRFQ